MKNQNQVRIGYGKIDYKGDKIFIADETGAAYRLRREVIFRVLGKPQIGMSARDLIKYILPLSKMGVVYTTRLNKKGEEKIVDFDIKSHDHPYGLENNSS